MQESNYRKILGILDYSHVLTFDHKTASMRLSEDVLKEHAAKNRSEADEMSAKEEVKDET